MTRSLVTWVVLALAAAAPGFAEPLPTPSGPVILTVTGAIEERNQGDAAIFDLETLRGLGEVSFTTATIWTNGDVTFTGVSLAALMERLGAEGAELKARALNDYTVSVPMSDAVEGGPIIAFEMNGKVMTVRDKGPLWLVYPYDLDTKYQSEVYFSRSIWQLSDIEVSD